VRSTVFPITDCVHALVTWDFRTYGRACIKRAVAAGMVVIGGVLVVASPFIYAACMRETSGLNQIHCLQAAGFFGTLRLWGLG
jgi:hypothetical protein